MCLILLVVFSTLSISFALDGLYLNALVNGAIALMFAILFGYKISTNKGCLFKKNKSDCISK